MIARIGAMEGATGLRGPVSSIEADAAEWRVQLQRSSLAASARAGLSPRMASLPLDLLIATIPPAEEAAPKAHAPLSPDGLGANRGLAAPITSAAERTGIPAPALAAIIDAEAARLPSGAWDCRCRNPRSTAAGLGQFLAGTWVGEAERRGSWLHDVATARGWLDAKGKVRTEDRQALLALREDPRASIEAIADYAKANLKRLERAGVSVDRSDVPAVARLAYIGHHLGPGDGARYLLGRLEGARAATLLNAQLGGAAAARSVRQSGDAVQAHRDWLESYVGRRIDTERFQA